MVRLKNRYIVVQINPKQYETDDIRLPFKINGNNLSDTIQDKVSELHGDFGVAATRAGFTAKYCNDYTRIAIVRSRHGPHKLVISSIPFIKQIESHNVSLNILYIGASIKKCFNFVKIHQERLFNEFCVKLKTDQEKLAFKEILLNFDNIFKTLTL